MEQHVVFRDYQEQQSADHNNLQAYARASFDHLVNDAVTATRRFAGFKVVKSNQAEVTIAPGRFYDQAGAVFNLPTQTVQSLVAYLPAVARRIVTIAAYGVENQVDVQTRDFLTNVTTGQTEPQAVAMTSSRDAVLAVAQGPEGPDPQAPAIPTTQIAVANVMLDPNGVVSVTMLSVNEVESTEQLDLRASALEVWKALIQPRVDSLASDLAALAAKVNLAGQQIDIVSLYQDMAEVKAKVGLPATYSQYGASYFLYPDSRQSDLSNALNLGFDALVEMGIRFPAANATQFEMALFSANDPNAAYRNGFLLPAYTSVLKIQTGEYYSSVGMAQYGYQTYRLVEQDIAYSRIRYGGSYSSCTNGYAGYTAANTTAAYWLPNFQTYQTQTEYTRAVDGGMHSQTTIDYYWHDSWTQPYWYLDTVNHTISGAQVAQSFLVSNDMWMTQLAFYLSAVASATDVWITVAQVTNGVPDLTKVILHQSVPGASLVTGWNKVACVPTFLAKGGRFAVILTSPANHQVGMAAGGSYLDGTFFYSMDGVYYLGDFTKEMMLQVWGAKFNQAQCTIEFGVINLDGGLRNIDITARTVQPASTQLIYEVRPNGAGEWLQISADDVTALTTAPPLCQFRARFVGTTDMQPGVQLTGSRAYVWRPKVQFTWVSTPQTLAVASSHITVKMRVERFNPTPHTLAAKLRIAGAYVSPSIVTTTLIDASLGAYEIVATFNLTATTSTFIITAVGTTNSPTTTFHVAELLWWAT